MIHYVFILLEIKLQFGKHKESGNIILFTTMLISKMLGLLEFSPGLLFSTNISLVNHKVLVSCHSNIHLLLLLVFIQNSKLFHQETYVVKQTFS